MCLSPSAKALFSTPPPNISPAPTTPVNQPPAGVTSAVPTNPPPPSSSSHDQRERHSRRRRGDRKGERKHWGKKGRKQERKRLTSPVSPSLLARHTLDSLSLGVEPRVDVSRLDLRVGRIISVRRHPLAETLSVQEVDVGENANRVVVSKLGAETHLEEVTPLYYDNWWRILSLFSKCYLNFIYLNTTIGFMTLCLELFQHHPLHCTAKFLKYNVLIQIQCSLSLSLSAAPGHSGCVAMQRQGL